VPKTVGPNNSCRSTTESYEENTAQLDRLHFKND